MEHAVWFGWLGGALLVARILPQVVRIARTGQTGGVSRPGVWCWLGNDIGWFAYGLTSGLPPLWVSSAALIALDITLLALLGWLRNSRRGDAAGVGWAALLLLLAVSSSPLLAAALIAASFAGTVPHAVRSVRDKDLSGISPATWTLAGADGILWLVYGASVGDGPVTLYAALTLACATIILIQLRRKAGAGRQTKAGRAA